PRKLLTVVTKSNAQRHGMVMWDEIAAEVAREFPDVTWDKMLVDAMTMRMTLKPASLDTIVATNLHVLVGRHAAGASRRSARGRAADAGDRAGDGGQSATHPRSRRSCEDGR